MSNPKDVKKAAAPPPVDLNFPANVAIPHATSLYEPAALLAEITEDDIEIVDANAIPLRRRAPMVMLRSDRAAASSAEVPDLPKHINAEPQRPSGPWTYDEAVPVPMVRRIVRNVPSRRPSRPSPVVVIRSFAPANEEERSWVIGGDTGLRVVAKGGEGEKSRLVAVYLAFQVVSYATDGTAISGHLRWHGLKPEQERAWMRKLNTTNGGERRAQLEAALSRFFSYADPRVGMVLRFLGGPATDGDTAAREGYQWWAPRSPAVKVAVDMSQVASDTRETEDFYCVMVRNPFIGIRRLFWRRWWPEEEERYLLGKKYAEEGVPKPQMTDGFTPNDRRAMMSTIAQVAGPVVGSLGKIAWAGDKVIEAAMTQRNLGPVSATRYTVYETED